MCGDRPGPWSCLSAGGRLPLLMPRGRKTQHKIVSHPIPLNLLPCSALSPGKQHCFFFFKTHLSSSLHLYLTWCFPSLVSLSLHHLMLFSSSQWLSLPRHAPLSHPFIYSIHSSSFSLSLPSLHPSLLLSYSKWTCSPMAGVSVSNKIQH